MKNTKENYLELFNIIFKIMNVNIFYLLMYLQYRLGNYFLREF